MACSASIYVAQFLSFIFFFFFFFFFFLFFFFEHRTAMYGCADTSYVSKPAYGNYSCDSSTFGTFKGHFIWIVKWIYWIFQLLLLILVRLLFCNNVNFQIFFCSEKWQKTHIFGYPTFRNVTRGIQVTCTCQLRAQKAKPIAVNAAAIDMAQMIASARKVAKMIHALMIK